MLFNSIDFLIFLPITFLLYWFVIKTRKWRNLLIFIVSYIFYGWWDPRFLVLIALTSLSTFISGLLIERYEKSRKNQRLVKAANIILNLGILAIFKYYNFFLDSIMALASACGIHLDYVETNIILPVGISFYTFQAFSYTIDVYQKKAKATHDIIEFFAYISFFPQLVAGPIERATHLLPQFHKNRIFDYAKAVDGMRQILWGFLKKIVIADNCAVIVDNYWGYHDILPGRMLIILGILFAFQIYCDFSGYSDIAIGCARLFGFNLTTNFKTPYFSKSIPDFWRRWHISLTTWFRDYLYFPLGGNRCSKYKVIQNVIVVWSLSGLWHGAKWTYIIWGLYHATILIIYNMIGYMIGRRKINIRNNFITRIIKLLQTTITFCLVVLGWIIFRAENISQAWHFISSIFNHSFMGLGFIDGRKWLMAGICILLIEWFQRNKRHALDLPIKGILRYRIARWSIYYILIYIIINFVGQNQAFIYFQF